MKEDFHTFVYRDVFFQLQVLYGCESGSTMLFVDGEAHGFMGYSKIWEGDSHPPLNELRKICDKYIERLICESIRAGGEAVCEFCGQNLYAHPYFHGALAFGNERPYLRRRCDGKLVKL